MERDPDEILSAFFDVEQWATFQGFGIIPGIKSAKFLERTDSLVGSRIAVENSDGSNHIEHITEASADGVSIRFELSAPVTRLATHFVETLRFRSTGNATSVERSMELHPRSFWSRLPLWVVSRFLRTALRRHLKAMADH